MPTTEENQESSWLSVIGRCLAYLCYKKADLDDKNLTDRAAFLCSLGLSRADCAAMLGTTKETIRVMKYQDKKKKSGGTRGRKKKPAKKAR